MQRLLSTTLLLIVLALQSATVQGQQSPGDSHRVVTFRFVPDNDNFYVPWAGNGEQLEMLYTLIDTYRSEIITGSMPIRVDGYCASGDDAKKNFDMAVVRSNRVKSELIMHKELAEEHFVTKNHATLYNGMRDVVVVTLQIPVPKPEPQPVARTKPEAEPRPEPQPEPKTESRFQPATTQEPVVPVDKPATRCPLSLRTNLLYDAFLLPTLGMEWRVCPCFGIKLDGSYSYWGSETGNVQKILLLSPELRWYMGASKRFYLGAGGNYAKYNVYGGLIGNLLPDDTGYQGSLWNAGLTAGYQLRLSRSFSLDFNLGLGYTHAEYDTFQLIDNVRVYKAKDQTKNFWGPTQAGISLVWRMGN